MLGLQKRTQTNYGELHWKNCCYPLRFQQKTAFQQELVGG